MKSRISGSEETGADAINLVCPFCSLMYDSNQKGIETAFNASYNIPVLYLTQILRLLRQLLEKVSAHFGLDREELKSGSKVPGIAKARAVFCYLGVHSLGLTSVSIAKELGISPSAVSKSIPRGRQAMRDDGIDEYLLECQ